MKIIFDISENIMKEAIDKCADTYPKATLMKGLLTSIEQVTVDMGDLIQTFDESQTNKFLFMIALVGGCAIMKNITNNLRNNNG